MPPAVVDTIDVFGLADDDVDLFKTDDRTFVSNIGNERNRFVPNDLWPINQNLTFAAGIMFRLQRSSRTVTSFSYTTRFLIIFDSFLTYMIMLHNLRSSRTSWNFHR